MNGQSLPRRAATGAPAGTAAPPGTSFAPVEGVPGTHAPGAVVECGSAAVPGSTLRTFVIELPEGTPIVTGNTRMHYHPKNKRIRQLKETAATLARKQRLPVLERAEITVTYVSPHRLKAMRHPLASDAISDADGIAPTAKACIDGLVMYGMFPSDSKRYVRKTSYVLADETHPRGLVRITISEVT
jgi:crossover junction endodeoxyribonuclease RusA